jgi:hypothetical protein
MEYYSNYILNEKFKIAVNELINLKSYYEVYDEKQLNIRIAKRYVNSNVDWVFYYDTLFSEILWNYHVSKFKDQKMALIEYISPQSFFVKEYADQNISRIWLYNIDADLKIKNELLFSPDFKLGEYRENIYNETGEFVKEKIFVPSLWIIQEEE